MIMVDACTILSRSVTQQDAIREAYGTFGRHLMILENASNGGDIGAALESQRGDLEGQRTSRVLSLCMQQQ